MIFIDKMKNLKIYKTSTFLPTMENDKKKKSAILLLSPNYEASLKLMKHNLFVNRLRYISYYIKRDISYYINSKNIEDVESSVEENYTSEKFLKYIPESCINTGDKVIFFNEDSNDSMLYRMMYSNRLKKRQDVLVLYDQVKNDVPYLKFTFPEIDKYKSKNLFVDLYFYNKVFFDNNSWVSAKGMNLYLRFMSRLIDDPELNKNGYSKKTIFIPIMDWCSDPAAIWNYRKSINPMSIIYNLMMTGADDRLLKTFGDIDILFIASDKYFKINFKDLKDSKEDFKKLANIFKLFLIKIVKKEEFDSSDVDTTADNSDSAEVIRANIIDKIELAKGVDLTKSVANSRKKLMVTKAVNNKTTTKAVTTKQDKKTDTTDEEEKNNKLDNDPDINNLADAINNASDTSNSEDEALDKLDNNEIKQIILDLDSKSDDKPDITAGRAGRISELDKKLLDSQLKGKTINDILNETDKKDVKPIDVNVSSPNADQWKNLTFAKFDSNYDIDRDIIRCFRALSETSRPISIRNLEVTNNSTSEDRIELYTAEMEDYRGKRFTIKLDIPIMVDNRFLLRGSNKSIQTQFFNMPIIKTEFDTCQIISNYMKIIVFRFGSGSCKSMPLTARFYKALTSYTGRKIKIEIGDNSKICNKYALPVDFIDLSSEISKITTDDFIVYFNQDEIRDAYTVDETKGIPFAYSIKDKQIIYYVPDSNNIFTKALISLFENYSDFMDLLYEAKAPKTCVYSKCSIMNSKIPTALICGLHIGLRKTMEKALIKYRLAQTLKKEDRLNPDIDWIKFSDGYLIYDVNYESSLLLNGLKVCDTELHSLADMDSKDMYIEFLDDFGGRIKADGLENFYDLMIDPMTKDSLEFYKFPTDYISTLLYANALLADNKFIKHTDASSRKLRRYMLIAVYTYKVLADAYGTYVNQLKHNPNNAEFFVKQSAVIDKFLTDTITSDDSCINALRDVEATNSITTKGPSGMNNDRAYSLDKRTYDQSMLNIIGMSTGFAGNVGIARQATINANVDQDGYVIPINGDTDKLNSSKSLTITEALTPFGTTHDDPFRTAMTFIQTAKHEVRTENADPLLVTNGSDEVVPYITTDKFAFKAKKNGTISEITDEYIFIDYEDGTKEYINLKETIEKNSDGGYYVPLKLDIDPKLKVGSKVKPDQIIAWDKYSFDNSLGESDNLSFLIGKLSKIAIINSDEGFEDSGTITEKLARDLATRVDLQFDATLDKTTNILSIVKIGDKVETGDPLLVWQAPFEDENANSLLKTLSDDDVSELGKKKITSEVTGVVKDIKIFRTVELEDMSESMRAIVDAYEKPLRALKKKLEKANLDISQVPAHYVLPPTGKLKKAVDAVVFEFYVEYLDTVGVGDKVVYYSANKAVEKSVIPLGKEPYTAFRPNESIDALVSEVSIDKRMVTSTLIIGSLQKLMVELDRSVKDIMGIPYDDSKV